MSHGHISPVGMLSLPWLSAPLSSSHLRHLFILLLPLKPTVKGQRLMDGSISFTLQVKHGGFGVNAILLNGNNQSKWFLLGLASCLEGLPWGEGCHENKLGVTLLLCAAQAQSSVQCRSVLRMLLSASRILWGCSFGCPAWGWQCLSLGELMTHCKISSLFQELQHTFSSCKGSSSADRHTTLTAGKLVGCLGAKVKLKYISKCLQDQDLIQA